jgi:hypothetical protein
MDILLPIWIAVAISCTPFECTERRIITMEEDICERVIKTKLYGRAGSCLKMRDQDDLDANCGGKVAACEPIPLNFANHYLSKLPPPNPKFIPQQDK